MKKIYFFSIIFVVFIFVLYVFFQFSKKNNNILGSATVSYTLNNKRLNLLVAHTEEEWERGLMFQRKLVNAEGMIFIFPDSRPRSFWNKNTFLDLDIFWINKGKVMGSVFLPSIEKTKTIMTVNSDAPADTVIELVREK